MDEFKTKQLEFNEQIVTTLLALEAEIDHLRNEIEQLKPKESYGTADTENETKN